jgi:hypothetical protein
MRKKEKYLSSHNLKLPLFSPKPNMALDLPKVVLPVMVVVGSSML